MQLRCTYCQTMFAISHDEMLAALQHMQQHEQKYYDAHCPKCRRANRVEGKRIEVFFPDWKKTINAMQKDAAGRIEKPVEKTPAVKKTPNTASGKVAPAKAPAGAVKPAAGPAKAGPKPGKPAAKPAVKPAAKPGAKTSGGIKKK
jgi:hypothetical protein